MQAEDLVQVRLIEAVKHEYCWRYDTGDLDGLMDLFLDDAMCELGPFGTWRGKAEIRAGYDGQMRDSGIPGTRMHAVSNPLIEVAGETARGRWYLADYNTEAAAEQPVRILATYDDVYRRDGGRWLIARTSIMVVWMAGR